jgi:hypothetical protein
MIMKDWSLKQFTNKSIWVIIVASLFLGTLVSLFPVETVIIILASIILCAVLIIMIQRPFAILLFLTILIPFEDFLVKFIPVSGTLQFALRQVSELLIYGSFALLLMRQLKNNRFLRRTPIDIWLLLFILIAIISMVLNAAPLTGSVINLRAMLRYTILFYLVVNLKLSTTQRHKILKTIVGIGVIQMLIGGLQLISRGAIDPILLPPKLEFEVAGITRNAAIFTQGREIGSIFGTLGDTIFLALFLLIVFAIYLGHVKKLNLKAWLIILIFLVAINYTFARGVVLASIFMLAIFLAFRWGKNRIIFATTIIIPFVIVGIYFLVATAAIYRDFNNPLFEKIGIIDNLTGIFTLDYIQRAQNQRLGALIGIPPTVMASKPFFGFGPDEETTIEQLNNSEPSFLYRQVVQKGFEDVYWTAIIAYFGVLGLFAFGMILFRILWSAAQIRQFSNDSKTRQLATTVLLLTLLTPPLLFFYRVLEFRSFSFYFWLLTGMMISAHVEESIQRKRGSTEHARRLN